ncbi:MAG: hypothetical protein OEV78_11945 [Spirochaetia bacterium]|nr:hypothetical protein [Spirochaetia bacterium]
MQVKIDKKNTHIRPFGLIVKFADRQICIPKSFILNKEALHKVENLELEDWFYNTYIKPFEQNNEMNY